MHIITKWVYCIVAYNWVWLTLLYATPNIRWNVEEKHMRSISGILHIFKSAGIIGFGALYATVFLVLIVHALNNIHLSLLAVVTLLSSMGVLGFDVIESRSMHCMCLVVLLTALVAYANIHAKHTTVTLNSCTTVFLSLIVANSFKSHEYETQQVVIELLWAAVATRYILQLADTIESVTLSY